METTRRAADIRSIEEELIRTRCFYYIRVGYDRRRMELLPHNRIGGGRSRLEQTWHVREEDGRVVLCIAGDEGITCALTQQADGSWHGQWRVYECMAVQLAPAIGDGKWMHVEADALAEPIDAVYLWVDGSDPGFQQSMRRASVAHGLASGDERLATRRFRDIAELKYSLRSLEAYAPWIRHVYIVTNGQVPAWLNVREPRMSLVTHEMLFPERTHLPTFNSHAIEVHLHRVPGLSRRFLYLNDDIFFGGPVSPADFLTADGVQKIYLECWDLPVDLYAGPAHDRAFAYTQVLLNRVVPPRGLRRAVAHTPQMYDRELIEEIEAIWPREMEETSAHPFRTPRDFVFWVLYNHFALESEKHCPAHRAVTVYDNSDEYGFIMLHRHIPKLVDALDQAMFQRPKFLCVNDDLDDSEEAEVGLSLCKEFLERYFPSPSRFELADGTDRPA